MFENKDKIILVQEYADGGELYDFISTKGKLTEKEARILFRQIVSAVHYLHEVGWWLSIILALSIIPVISLLLPFINFSDIIFLNICSDVEVNNEAFPYLIVIEIAFPVLITPG